MNSRIVIIVLTSIIIIQMIAGLYIINRPQHPYQPGDFIGMMDDDRGIGMGKQYKLHKHMKGNRYGMPFCEPGFMRNKLLLNQEQIEKISMLNKKFEEEFSGFSSKIRPEKEKLKKLLESNTDDLNAVRNQLKIIEDINVEIHLLRIKQGRQISKILTPDQMNILRDERKQLFEKMRGNPGGPR